MEGVSSVLIRYLTLQNLKTTSGLSMLLHGVITLLDAMSCDHPRYTNSSDPGQTANEDRRDLYL